MCRVQNEQIKLRAKIKNNRARAGKIAIYWRVPSHCRTLNVLFLWRKLLPENFVSTRGNAPKEQETWALPYGVHLGSRQTSLKLGTLNKLLYGSENNSEPMRLRSNSGTELRNRLYYYSFDGILMFDEELFLHLKKRKIMWKCEPSEYSFAIQPGNDWNAAHCR